MVTSTRMAVIAELKKTALKIPAWIIEAVISAGGPSIDEQTYKMKPITKKMTANNLVWSCMGSMSASIGCCCRFF